MFFQKFQPLAPWQENGPGIRYKVFWRRRDDEKEFQMLELDPKTRHGVAIVPISNEYFYTEYNVKVQVGRIFRNESRSRKVPDIIFQIVFFS